jgi:hypothetical protein
MTDILNPMSIAATRKRLAPTLKKLIKHLKEAVNDSNGATEMKIAVNTFNLIELTVINETFLNRGWQVMQYFVDDEGYNGRAYTGRPGTLHIEYVGETPKQVELKVEKVKGTYTYGYGERY